jgi:hypothetical protein
MIKTAKEFIDALKPSGITPATTMTTASAPSLVPVPTTAPTVKPAPDGK